MILPCRIHRARNRNHVDSLPLALLFAACLLAPIGEAMAVKIAAGSASEAGWCWAGCQLFHFKSQPVWTSVLTTTLLGSNATTGGSGQGSLSVRENLVLTYDRPAEPTEFHLIGVGRFTQFSDVGSDDKDRRNRYLVAYA